jgi:hypothetical protein
MISLKLPQGSYGSFYSCNQITLNKAIAGNRVARADPTTMALHEGKHTWGAG